MNLLFRLVDDMFVYSHSFFFVSFLRYRTFYEDSKNVSWFVVAAITGIVSIMVSIYVVATFVGRGSPSLTKLNCKW